MAKLKEYRQKRRFDRTPEPSGDDRKGSSGRRFVVQKHAARRLHYDFRLELDGALKSWAVPKGPSLDPDVRSLAVHVEDHPLSYADFEGVIPAGEYGGGTVMVWDQGEWTPEGDPDAAYRQGKLSFELKGEKLRGRWTLVRMHSSKSDDDSNWLLLKRDDKFARCTEDFDICREEDRSALSRRSMEEIAGQADRVWSSRRDASHDQDGMPAPKGIESLSEDAARLSGRTRRKLPSAITPQLATPAPRAPGGEEWLHELKFDGYRLLSYIEPDDTRLLTRRGNDWTDRFPTVAGALAKLPCEKTILDGEVVILARDGTTDFQALQNLMNSQRDDEIVYFIFDLLFFDGYDLRKSPLVDRKRLLAELLRARPEDGVLRYSDHIVGQGREVFTHACRRALEGIVSKRTNAAYQHRRSTDWVKSKCIKRQEFVIGGWTDPSGSREAFGALLLGYHEDGQLRYCGRVGTGFNRQSLLDLEEQLREISADKPPFADPPTGSAASDVHWVRPTLVAEVEFANWTADGILRQASFQGLREDKPAAEVVREDATPALESKNPTSPRKASVASKTAPAASSNIADVALTHPERVLYPDQGVTKRELAEYYQAVAQWIMPHVAGRPVTLVRCPQGRKGQCFYQKHLTDSMPEQLRGVEIEEKGARREYVVLDDLAGLIALVQISALELHPWPAREDRLDRPDRLIIDLDPGENVSWRAMIVGALQVRQRLADCGMQSYLRTTGGKGLHVVAPLVRRNTWDELKQFAKGLAHALADAFPDRYIATASKAKREGKVFVDYLRNQYGATAIASYSTRARAGAPVATPLRWQELDENLRPDTYNLRNLPRRLAALSDDPWEDFFDLRQSLTKAALSAYH